ncbi:MAG: hypothetical protein ACXW1A_05690 [Nitrososphaeraceae archaeon]
MKFAIKERKVTSVIFLKNSCIPLFEKIVRNLDDIEIKFKGEKIDENLILFKGTFFNNGNIDIDSSIIHKPLEIELPSNFSWVTYKVIDTSDNLEVNLTENDNKLSFEWDLFKEAEHITIDCLIEYKHDPEDTENTNVDISKVLLRGIKFNQRITNLKVVSNEGSIKKPMPGPALAIFSFLILSFVSAGFYESFKEYTNPSYKLLHEVNIDSKSQYVELKASSESNITFIDDNEDKIKSIPINELNNYLSKNVSISREGINYWKLIGFGAMSILYLIIFLSMLFDESKKRKLYKKLQSVAEKHDENNDDREGLRSPWYII